MVVEGAPSAIQTSFADGAKRAVRLLERGRLTAAQSELRLIT